jgi:phospholipid N-methyltransferase
LALKSSDRRMVVIERSSSLVDSLRLMEGEFELVHSCISELAERRQALGLGDDLVLISSIPWLSLPEDTKALCLDSVIRVVSEVQNLRLIQYTYSPKSPLEISGLKGRIVAQVWKNFPPAWIWLYEKDRT